MRTYDECRPYMEHLAAEHRRLNEMLHRAQHMFPNWEEVDIGEWLPRVVQQWRAIREHIAHHFQTEEEGGCLQEAASHCPSLLPEVNEIIAEHPQLLVRLDELIGRAEHLAKPGIATAQVIEQEFLDFIKAMRRHEAKEDRVLQRGFAEAFDLSNRSVT